jgi:hypothetical protein
MLDWILLVLLVVAFLAIVGGTLYGITVGVVEAIRTEGRTDDWPRSHSSPPRSSALPGGQGRPARDLAQHQGENAWLI